jgi:hypothetical protein
MTQSINDHYAIYNNDCIQVCSSLPDRSIHYSIFSPPFADLYCYSDSNEDMGNCKNYDEFFIHLSFLIKELKRLIMDGRLVSIHCMDIPAMKERDGFIGVKDFSGDLIREMQKNDFIYHGRHTIWKDPLIEATRTKAIGLMHKQLCKDSTISRSGLPDYLLTFRKCGENQIPVSHPDGLSKYCGSKDPGGEGIKRSHNIWRAYASPVWMDVRQTRTLNFRQARHPDDEKHICPLQLDVIERGVLLYTNPGETVLTPFMGVGSECYGAVINGRKAIGIELKESYFNQARKNLEHAVESEAERLLL